MGRASGTYLVWMYQIQYNCTADEMLVYRILPSTSDSFLLKNLVPAADYSLCVLAIFDDAVTSLAATTVVGCAQFSTGDAYPACRPLQAHFLGGTLTVMVGGVVVVMLLVFTVTMMVRHRVCSGGGADGPDAATPRGSSPSPKGTHVYSQTNGSGGVVMVVVPNGILPQQRGGGGGGAPPRPKPKTLPKPKVNLDVYRAAGGGGAGLAVAVSEKRLPPYTPEIDRMALYYTPAPAPSTLPRQVKLRYARDRSRDAALKPAPAHGAGEAARDWRSGAGGGEVVKRAGGDRWNSSHAYQSPPAHGALRPKRSSSFDMGEIATTTCYGYAKRLSVIWTRRSQSLHGMLVHCASATGGDDCHVRRAHGYLRAYSDASSTSNPDTPANAEELEESVV
ncbi:hypothetical protein AAFF_G00157090 [Aldrovandia affinis]|uniref:Fibronectin type-III domain-containing protein n=1 Tax=Aldrovandia affinis TaxID=143900 RepID=A0AAD7RR71_9TELE|nr:hypothetical protein AAFF_G00157090 [Aldrovandia affinis]